MHQRPAPPSPHKSVSLFVDSPTFQNSSRATLATPPIITLTPPKICWPRDSSPCHPMFEGALLAVQMLPSSCSPTATGSAVAACTLKRWNLPPHEPKFIEFYPPSCPTVGSTRWIGGSCLGSSKQNARRAAIVALWGQGERPLGQETRPRGKCFSPCGVSACPHMPSAMSASVSNPSMAGMSLSRSGHTTMTRSHPFADVSDSCHGACERS